MNTPQPTNECLIRFAHGKRCFNPTCEWCSLQAKIFDAVITGRWATAVQPANEASISSLE